MANTAQSPHTASPTTLLKSVKIEGLFELFDYTIEYPTEENVLIITGPNGFGKTQVLNIIFHLFNKKFSFFQQLVFSKITVSLTRGTRDVQIIIDKTGAPDVNIMGQQSLFLEDSTDAENYSSKKKPLRFLFLEGEKLVGDFPYSLAVSPRILVAIEQYLPVEKIDEDRWRDLIQDKVMGLEELLAHYAHRLPDRYIGQGLSQLQIELPEQAQQILDGINVHLIREQRLFKKVQRQDRNYPREREETIMTETIQAYANELKKLINERIQASFSISQHLDSTYPNRLISEKRTVLKEEYDARMKALADKLEKLTKNGLYESEQKVLPYSKDDSKALLVYLNDLDKKISVFDELLEKLELFTDILNERRFTYKSIAIDKKNGFYFKTSSGKKLELHELSSGEQHEVVLLYELIFKTEHGILVLIDEPEISLHISWQKEFLSDLLRIIKMQDFQVLIATHSPSIVNDRWDLVYTLQKK